VGTLSVTRLNESTGLDRMTASLSESILAKWRQLKVRHKERKAN